MSEELGERARQALEDYAPPPPPRGVADRVLHAAHAPARPGAAWLAAAVVAVAAAGGFVLLALRAPVRTHVAIARETLPLGERAVAVMEAGAALRVDTRVRTEQLAGKVHYDLGPGRSPFVIATPLGTVTSGDDTTRFDVEVRPMPTKVQKLAVASGAVAIALVVYVREGRVQVQSPRGTEDAQVGERVVATADGPPRLAPAPVATVHEVAPERAHARETMLHAIAEARARREAAAPAAAGKRADDTPAPADADLDKPYIREQVRALLPLLSECYANALHDSPTLAGDLVVKFTVSGEPGVGGLVTSSEVTPDSTIHDAGMIECVSQTMYAVDLKPPADGGEVTIVYPFSFAP